ncbi:MAG: hypothetical protein KGM49_01545 [Sphingomonadales bacterium]|nr:hypothetical protein [Sphingomonadales bacterium]
METILDLTIYPIDRPGSPEYVALVDRCRESLQAEGMFELPGFMRPEIAAKAAALAAPAMANQSFRHARTHNIYFLDEVEGIGPDHPALGKVDSVNHTLCGDQIDGNPVLDLYDWEPFAAFLAATMDKQALYRMNDPIARVNIQSTRAGEALNWHFDRSEFTTTLLLQAPQQGGELEYRKNLRSPNDHNFDGVAAVLRGEDALVRRQTLQVGALNVFRGVNTLHRVVPVSGPVDRMVAILSYYENPGVAMTDAELKGFYGRSTAA